MVKLLSKKHGANKMRIRKKNGKGGFIRTKHNDIYLWNVKTKPATFCSNVTKLNKR